MFLESVLLWVGGQEGSRIVQKEDELWYSHNKGLRQFCREFCCWQDPSELTWTGDMGLELFLIISKSLYIGCPRKGSNMAQGPGQVVEDSLRAMDFWGNETLSFVRAWRIVIWTRNLCHLDLESVPYQRCMCFLPIPLRENMSACTVTICFHFLLTKLG
jgi:hypothetical protein